MNPDVDSYSNSATAFSVLVVDPALSDLMFVVSALSALRVHVTVAETFAQARDLLARQAPDVLITAIRLGEYNGLHLVLRGKAERPEMTAIVTALSHDSVLEADADAMQTTFVVMPTSEEELRAAVLRTRFRTTGNTLSIRPPFERREQERRIGPPAGFTGHDRREQFHDRRRNMLISLPVPLIG